MGNSDSLADQAKFRHLIFTRCCPCLPAGRLHSICKGLPCYPTWLPLRVTPATPGVHLFVLVVFVKIGVPAFPLWP